MTETGIWNQSEADKYHQHSPKLATWLENYLDPEEIVYDFGCGQNYYLAHLEKCLNEFQCLGFEGEKLNNFFSGNVMIRDLTKPIEIRMRGSVLSLEVGEHLPKWSEQTFLDTITGACLVDLVMSWATLGQPGVGHINNQPHDYIISEVERRGFEFLQEETKQARLNVDDNCSWFQRNLMVFERK